MNDVIHRLISESSIQCKDRVLTDVKLKKCEKGIYAWFFKKLPPQLDEYKHRFYKREGKWLLYVGICPSFLESNRVLRDRIRTHYSGNASGSTLRMSLGCLLSDRLGITLQVVGNSKRRLKFGGDELYFIPQTHPLYDSLHHKFSLPLSPSLSYYTHTKFSEKEMGFTVP